MPHLPVRNISILILSAFLALPFGEAPGQQPPPASRRIIRAPDSNPNPVSKTLLESPIKSFQFAGGTLSDFAREIAPLAIGVDRVRVSNPNSAPIPPLHVENSTLLGLIQRLSWITNGALSFNMDSEGDQTNTYTVLRLSYLSPPDSVRPENRYFAEFDFKGGTVADLAEKIRGENLGWTNIYVKPAAANQPIPAFKVQRVSFLGLQEILLRLTDSNFSMSWTGTFLMIDYRIRETDKPTTTAILPLRILLESYTIEDINALVLTALKMADARTGKASQAPDMSLHRETDTLIVVGPNDQVDLVKSVIDALAKQPFPRTKKTPAPPSAKAAP